MESLSRPLFHHRRKLSTASSTAGLSFSGKDAYDDVFAAGPKPKFGAAAATGLTSRKVAVEDYVEIFGGRNGTRGSSIPVLDLSDLDDRNGSADFRSSSNKLDYSTIFGGFGGGRGGGGDDGVAASVAVPSYEELFSGVKKGKTGKAKTRISADIRSPLKGSERFNSSENNKSQSSEESDQMFDGGKQFNLSYHKTGQRRKDGSNGTTHIAQFHAVPGFTYVIDETARLQKTEQNKAKHPVKVEVNHNRSSTDHLQKTEQDDKKPPVRVEVSYNRSSSDCLQKTEQDKAMPPVIEGVSHNRSFSDRPQKTEQHRAMPPVNLEVNHNRTSSDDISEGKSGKRAKWQLPTAQASESSIKDKGKCDQHASISRDKLFDADELDLKSHSSEVPSTSSSSANLNDSKRHRMQSESSNYGSKVEASEKVADGYSTPFSDEELDVNSAAASSAAALKKAIEQAQESIRIAKEIMERKRNSFQSSKLHSIGRSKEKDSREIHVEEAKRENDVKEACESVESKVEGFIAVNQNIELRSGEVASFSHTEKPSTDTQADVAMNENVEVAEENGVAMWFTQLLNSGKHRMAALASELVGKKINILQPLTNDVQDIQETKAANLTLEWDAPEQVNAVDRILEFRDIENKLNAVGRQEKIEKIVDNSDSSLFAHEDDVSETLVFAQEDEVTNNVQHGFDEGEKCDDKFADCHVTIYDRPFELKQSLNVLSEDESLKLEQKLFDQEVKKKQEHIRVWEENDCKVDEEETDKKQEEFHPWIVNEDESEKATGYMSNGKMQGDDYLESYPEQEIDEQRSTESFDDEENQIMLEEEHVWEAVEKRPELAGQNEEAGSRDDDADSSLANRKMDVNHKVQEIGNTTQAGTDRSADNPWENLFQEAFNKEYLNTAVDVCNIDQSANFGHTHEACRSEVENISEQTSELETEDLEENGNQAGFTEQTVRQESSNNEEEANKVGVSESLYEFEQDANSKEAVEEASRLKGKHILETSSGDHGDGEENFLESITPDVSEDIPSDDKTADFGFTKISHEVELSKDAETVKSFIHNGTEEDATDSEDAKAPAVKNLSNFDCTDMNGQKQTQEMDRESEFAINTENCNGSIHEFYGQKHIEESDRESESGIDSESGDGSFHESTGNAENIKVNGIASEKEIEKDDIEIGHKERECIENEKEVESSQFPCELQGDEHVETNPDMKSGQITKSNGENVSKTFVKEEKEIGENVQKEEERKDCHKRTEVNNREREREKDRIAVERAIREARERAFAEARERAERAAVEKATAEVRQRAMAGAREKLEKVSAGTKVATDKASIEAKLRAERAAVERATAEARERALEKAMSQKTTSETRSQAERSVSEKFSAASRDTRLKHSFSSSDLERFDGTNNESAQRRKARLERHQRIMERAAKALAEKNLRDVLAQREQAERNRLAETLDADIKRWASGKEGNLRALLSTLQYILGPGSGWQPISLTEIITTNAVKKAYRKATLYVHPDKLQQRGASIQQKYICEKVFDLLKAAWNKFNSEER